MTHPIYRDRQGIPVLQSTPERERPTSDAGGKFDPEVEIPEDYYQYKTLFEQCEAGVNKFSNDQMSAALVLIESAWKRIPSRPPVEGATYTVTAEGCGDKTLDQVAEDIEILSQALRSRSGGTKGIIHTAEVIMRLAADAKADAEKRLTV